MRFLPRPCLPRTGCLPPAWLTASGTVRLVGMAHGKSQADIPFELHIICAALSLIERRLRTFRIDTLRVLEVLGLTMAERLSDGLVTRLSDETSPLGRVA